MSKKKFKITVNGKTFIVEVEELEKAPTQAFPVSETPRAEVRPLPREKIPTVSKAVPERRVESPSMLGVVKAPMSGVIVSIRIEVGERVEKGNTLLVLEAMKMENEIYSPMEGAVKELRVSEGERVNSGDILVVIE